MPEEENNDIVEAGAFGVRVVAVGAVSLLHLIVILHYMAAYQKVDFSVVKEVELMLGCMGVLTAILTWAFKKKTPKD